MESFNTDHSEEQKPEQQQDQATFKVGEREYDIEAAAKKISSADEHIQRIEAENAELRKRAESALSEEEISKRVEQALQKLQASQAEGQSKESNSSFDPEKLTDTAKQAALEALKQEREQERLAEQKSLQEKTFNETRAALQAKFGEDLDSVLPEVTGLSLEKAISMAKDPELSKALLRLVDIKPKVTSNPVGEINSASLGQSKSTKLFEGKAGRLTSKDIVQKLNELRSQG